MKIHQLPIGARFRFEGEEYAKTGPLVGTRTQDGRQRLIPRHAVLEPLDAFADAPAPKGATLARADVLAAFESFAAECALMVGDEGRAALSAARERFLKALD